MTSPRLAEAALLAPAGPIAAANRTILLNSLTIMLAIVIPTIVVALLFAWWFRAGNTRAKRDPRFVYSGRVELVIWSIPILVILFLGGVIWVGSHRLDPRRPIETGSAPALQVEVVALDWKWLFIYPEQQVASVNRLVLPVGRPVRFRLTSASVMNAFFVPKLGSMIYAMNGMATELNLLADRPGRYPGLSAHYSGTGFADMRFVVDALPAGQFDQWAQATARRGASLDFSTYPRLAMQSSNVRPFTFGSVQPRLFDAIVSRRLPPAPGPGQGTAATDTGSH